MKRKSFRQRFVFWLDITKSHEADIAETIEELKDKRSFAKTIRDGIRLIVDLRRGNTEVLFELFPLLKSKLQAEFSGAGLSEEKLRAIIWEATNAPTSGISMKPLPSNGNHQTHTPPPPNFDDDDLGLDLQSLVKKAGTSKPKDGRPSTGQNFINMINAINNETGGWAVKK